MKTAFLSHSSSDGAMAQRLCAFLEERGIACWIAPRDILPGQSYALGCLEGVTECESFVLLASEKALGSVQVVSEVEQAHKRAKHIYTVLIPPAKVRGEMDFYISRLHWIESGGRTEEEVGNKLAAVLAGEREWRKVASPPTLQRTMRYRPVAFMKLLTATIVGLVVVAGTGLYVVNRMLDLDFRRLGYVNLAAEAAQGDRPEVSQAQVWLLSPGVRFMEVRLRVGTKGMGGPLQEREYAQWEAPDQMGDVQQITIPLDAATRRITTCLIVPSLALHRTYRVTQSFSLLTVSEGIRAAETGEKRVSREDGSPCGPKL